jgi:hypothetical protein
VVLRAQLPADGLYVCFDLPEGMEIQDFKALRERDAVARLHRGFHEGRRHGGGVTFAVLE